MHVTRAYWPDQLAALVQSYREDDEDESSAAVHADGNAPVLICRMGVIRNEKRISGENLLDLGDAHAVLLALLQVPHVPLEAGRYNHGENTSLYMQK
jgi:hypothetical protein